MKRLFAAALFAGFLTFAALQFWLGKTSAEVSDHRADLRGRDTFGGRTFEDWRQLTLTDLEEETRIKGYAALSSFAEHGRNAEAAAALEAALPKVMTLRGLLRCFQALKSTGKVSEPAFVRGLQHPSPQYVHLALVTLRQPISASAGDSLIEALLKLCQDRRVDAALRHLACRAVAVQVMGHDYNGDAAAGNVRTGPAIEAQLNRVVPVLEQLLKDEDPYVSDGAAAGLLRISLRRPKLMATVLDYIDAENTSPRPVPPAIPRGRIGDGSGEHIVGALPPGVWPRAEPADIAVGGHSQDAVIREFLPYRTNPRFKEVLLPSLPHVKSLCSRYPGIRQWMSFVLPMMGIPLDRAER